DGQLELDGLHDAVVHGCRRYRAPVGRDRAALGIEHAFARGPLLDGLLPGTQQGRQLGRVEAAHDPGHDPDHTEGVERIVVRGGGPLEGTVRIEGAKNSVLKLMAASLMTPGRFVLRNVPHIVDVEIMSDLLFSVGADVRRTEDHVLTIDVRDDLTPEAPYELVEQMRASIVVLGPLLARTGYARVALPGGDNFGPRPIDMHLRGLEALGARFETAHGYVEARCDQLVGTRVVLEFPSVGATENLLMAAGRAT